MGDVGDMYRDYKKHRKKEHAKRVSKTPSRIEFAIEMFNLHHIEWVLKNETTGHFHCWRKADDKLFQFYAGTGKIQGYEIRGIHNLIKLLESEV